MVVRVLDLETTGIEPGIDEIIEIASVDLLKGGGISAPMSTYVRPSRGIPASASAVHHIIDADVANAPIFAEAITPFQGADVYIAHNSAFERSFLEQYEIVMGPSFHRTGEDAPWICTFKCALRAWPDLPAHSNQFLRYQLGLVAPFDYSREQIVPHRATSDVIVTAAILIELMKTQRWSQLLEWSTLPALFTRFSFGKHKGERFDAVDPSYLDWIINKSDLDEGVKFSARHWLALKEAA